MNESETRARIRWLKWYALRDLAIVCAVLWYLFFVAWSCDRAGVHAQESDWPVWTEESKLDLARCIMAESDFNNEKEAAAISWVLIKRWRQQSQDWDFHQNMKRYCAVWDERSPNYYLPRAKRIRVSAWSKPLHISKEQWDSLRSFVSRLTEKNVSDPCPRATHWAGRTDTIPPTWTCPCRFGDRGNWFCYPQR